MTPESGRLPGAAGTLVLVVAEAGGGTRIFRISYLWSSVESSRSKVVRDLMPCCGVTVVTLSQSMNCITRWVIPISSAFACIM